MKSILRIPALAVVALFVLGVLSWSVPSTDVHAVTGLQNAGFEGGVLNGLPAAWSVATPVPDVVKVVGAEGPAGFPTYADMGNVTVSPNRGAAMLRLGTPQRLAQNQTRGTNAVSQTFTSAASTLSFGVRAFSWEPRNQDLVGFNLTTSSGASAGTLATPVVLTMADGTQRTCSALPCAFKIDVGDQGQYIDTGWQQVQITDVPVGVPLTLSYSAGGSGDNSHATWAYFDDANAAGVPKFSFSPLRPVEGQLVRFSDQSFDPDSGDTIVSWRWTINGDTFDATNPVTIFPDEGVYTATLTVTSSDGTTRTVSTGQTAADGTAIPQIIVGNSAPLVGALNIEALPSQAAPLLGRFLDQGWLDDHSATWSVGGANTSPVAAEDHLAPLSTGLVTGSFSSTTSVAGTLTLDDQDGGVTSDPFQFNVVADDPQRHEPNDSLAAAPALQGGGSYLSYIQSEGDVDIFEVRMPGGGPLPAGAQVLASLKELPADLDLAILSQTPAGPPSSRFAQSDFGVVGFDTARFAQSFFAQSRFAQSRFAQSRFAQSFFAQSRFAQSGFSFSEFPLSALGYTGLDGTEIGGTDITLGELGLGDAPADVRVAGFSANRGNADEVALARTDISGTRIFVVVSGANGARSTTPYRLQLETSAPVDIEAALGPDVCGGTPLVAGTNATTASTVLYENPGAVKTLFITQRERIRQTYNMDDAAWLAFQTDLVALAQHPAVAGKIVSLPSNIFDDWDKHPCSIDSVNGLAAVIRDTVQGQTAGIENVVFVGDDNIVPQKRVPDETVVSNERDYAIDSLLKPGSPLFASMVQGYNLTDDYYVDAEPSSFQGRELYQPDIPNGRLVETPDEIRAAARAFVESDGQLNPATGFVSGYDFFVDGSQASADALGTKLSTSTQINDTWTAADLRCSFLGQTTGGLTGCSVADVNAINAHFTHYGALSAGGFASGDFGDFMSSNDVAAAGAGSTPLQRTLTFTMGCHAGLNVPARDALPPDPGLGIDPALDFPQAMALQKAIYIASTGFGLGDDQGIGGTERLMSFFAQDLMAGNVGAGQALVDAKRRYLAGLSPITVYDEKSSIQTTFFGLPMYRVNTPIPTPASPLAAASRTMGATEALGSQAAAAALPASSNLSLTTIDGTPSLATIPLQQVTTVQGSYYTAAGDAQSTSFRPIEPRVVLPVAPDGNNPVHGVVVTGGGYTDTTPFDPVISRPTTEWESGASEPQTCLDALWPSFLTRLNTSETPNSIEQTLVVIPGQFRCTSGAAPQVSGTQRLFTALTMELMRCPSTDTVPPAVNSFDIRGVDQSTIAINVNVSDASGIARIVVLRIADGIVAPTILTLANPTAGDFSVNVPNLRATDEYVVQIQDGACNVSVITGKGVNLRAIHVDGGPDKANTGGSPIAFTGTILGYRDLTAPVMFVWDFGDGSFESKVLTAADVTVDALGNGSFTVQHTYASATTPRVATIKVTDTGGGVGADDVNVLNCPLDQDCDGVADSVDNCISVANPLQGNNDRNFIDLSPYGRSFNDTTYINSDILGDACDPDDDNDGIPDVTELTARPCPSASGPTDPLKLDTDGDRVADGAECALGTDPANALSTPPFAPADDADRDGLSAAFEVSIGTDPAKPDTDGDGVLDGTEVKYYNSNPLAVDTDLDPTDNCADGKELASVNDDRRVNSTDLLIIATATGQGGPNLPYVGPFDLNKDGKINSIDLLIVAKLQGNC